MRSNLNTIARTGFAARGMVYLLLGYFAWTTGGGEATTTVMERLHGMPLGNVLLFLIAGGLFAYGLFRIYSSVTDIKGKGSDAKGLFGRTGPLLSGLAHLLLTVIAVTIALDIGRSGGGGERELADAALDLPGGTVLVAAAGLIGIAAGIGNFVKAWTCAFMRDLSPETPQMARAAGRAGYAARGVVFGLIGWQIVSLALSGGGGQLGMESAMQQLRSRDWLFPLVAIGLGAFGVFSLIMARYARVGDSNGGGR
jgi:hypothetical protein